MFRCSLVKTKFEQIFFEKHIRGFVLLTMDSFGVAIFYLSPVLRPKKHVDVDKKGRFDRRIAYQTKLVYLWKYRKRSWLLLPLNSKKKLCDCFWLGASIYFKIFLRIYRIPVSSLVFSETPTPGWLYRHFQIFRVKLFLSCFQGSFYPFSRFCLSMYGKFWTNPNGFANFHNP